MAGAGRVLVALGVLVVGAVAAGLWFVSGEPVDAEPTTAGPETAGPAAKGPAKKDAVKAPSRRKAKVAGDCTVTGTVRRRRDSAPAAGEEIVLEYAGAEPWVVVTDAGGTFTFSGVSDGGPYELRLASKGFATVRLPGIVLSKAEERDVGTLWLDQAVKVQVHVRSWTDQPIDGATVEAFAAPDWQRSGGDWQKMWAQLSAAPVAVASATTGKDGSAEFAEMASGTWTFTAHREGYGRDGRANVKLEGGIEPPVVKIHLSTGHALRGHVLDGNKRPVEGVLVTGGRNVSMWDLGAAPLRARSTTRADGTYELTSLPTGDIALNLAPKGGALSQQPSATVRVPNVKEYDLYLRVGGSLSGTVTESASGKPVEGVVVRAYGQRSAEATTDAAGKYVIPAVPDGPIHSVMAMKDGWLQDTRDEPPYRPLELQPGDTATRDIKMRQGAKLKGVVRGPDGPVAGARIVAWTFNPNGQTQKVATTDAEGRYEAGPIDTGKAMVTALKEGFIQPGVSENYVWAMQQGNFPPQYSVDVPEAGEVTLDVQLVKGARVEGRVEAEGAPVADATVLMMSGALGQSTVRSGADGTFVLEGALPGAKVRLWPSKEGYIAAKIDPVDVPSDGAATGVVLKLVKKKVVRGKVASREGGTLRDAQVQVFLRQQTNPNQAWTPDMQRGGQPTSFPVAPDGSYEAEIAWAEGVIAVRAQAIDHAPAESESVTLVETQETYEANVLLDAGYAIRGRVASKGMSIQGADVTVTPSQVGAQMERMQMMDRGWGGGPGGIVVAVTDAEGVFAIANVAAGTYAVTASAEGYVRAGVNGVKVPTSGDVAVEVEAGLEITGTVMLSDGHPVPGVTVVAQKDQPGGQEGGRVTRSRGGYAGPYGGGVQALAGPDGRFRLRGLAPGDYRLQATPPWGDASINVRSALTDPVAAGTSDYKLVVQPGGTISGRVVDPMKKPIASVWVYANPAKPSPGEQGRNARTKPDGTFEITGLGDGPYHVNAQPPQYGDAAAYIAPSLQNVGVGSKDVELAFDAGLSIEGSIVDGAGKPLADAMVSIQVKHEPGKPSPSMNYNRSNKTSDANGRFRFDGLGAGKYVIQFNAWQGSRHEGLYATGGEEVMAGTTDLRLTAVVGGKISGVVVDETGSGLQNVQVFAYLPTGGGVSRYTQTDKEGRFELTGLPPQQQMNLNANFPGRAPQQLQKVDVGSAALRIVMPKGQVLSGRLADGRGEGAANLQLHFQQTDGNKSGRGWAQTGADGRFTCETLPEGMYDILVNRPKPDAPNSWEQVKVGSARSGTTGLELRLP